MELCDFLAHKTWLTAVDASRCFALIFQYILLFVQVCHTSCPLISPTLKSPLCKRNLWAMRFARTELCTNSTGERKNGSTVRQWQPMFSLHKLFTALNDLYDETCYTNTSNSLTQPNMCSYLRAFHIQSSNYERLCSRAFDRRRDSSFSKKTKCSSKNLYRVLNVCDSETI